MAEIKILQLGTDDWNLKYNIPKNLKVVFSDSDIERKKEIYDIVFIERNLNQEQADIVKDMSLTYCFFAIDDFQMDEVTKKLFKRRCGQFLKRDSIQNFINDEAKKFFPEPYGEKFRSEKIGVAQGFKGTVAWDGNYSVSIEGDYGYNFSQIVYWKNNIPLELDQGIEFWLEYKKDPSVEILLSIKLILKGSLSDVIKEWEFNEDKLELPVIIENDKPGYVFCSLKARGKGKLDIIGLHDRISRWERGKFMVGGERHVTSEREEIFTYFDPGDLKPPLAVYFSGYKTREGFEGFYMMRKMGCPFLLVAEQRFEGGGFYIGSPEYEQLMVETINHYLMKLGFYSSDLILSGISMGTIGSLYYGCDLKPHALILGKPLASLGDIAFNERLNRPKGFPTSLDLLRHYSGGMSEENVRQLNDRIWNKVNKSDFSHTKFIVSYMFEDDYDSTAYDKLLSSLNSAGVQVYGKGLHGRHNDNSAGIGAWFKGQYERVLKEDFGR